MSVTLNFTSPGNPPNNIASFQIERSVRAASGTIAVVGDVDNVLKVVTVTFTGTPPADGALAGDQMHIGGLLYTIVTNTSTTITFTSDTDLSTIVTFPAAFDILNDLAEFSSFEVVGSVAPTIPFTESIVHQFTDATGTIFDYYRIRSVDSGGTVSDNPLTKPFRVGQVVNLAIDDARNIPKDNLKGVIGGSVTFEVTVMIGGRRQDPIGNAVTAQLFAPSYLAPNGQLTEIANLQMTRVGLGRYTVTWTIPENAPASVGGFALFPSDQYLVSYKANFQGLVSPSPATNSTEFDSELFELTRLDGPVHGQFPPDATVEDLRMTFFEIDAYLPESIPKSDVEGRNKVLMFHLKRASDKLREELSLHQIRAHSQDRNEYVCARSVYTIIQAARGENASALSDKLVDQWDDRAEKILAQLKREGVAQGIPMGRG